MKNRNASYLKRNMAALAAFALAVTLFAPASAAAQAECADYEDCLAQAEDAYYTADYESAVLFYEQACAAAPDSDLRDCREAASDAWLQKGDVSYNAEDYPSAIDDFSKAIDLAPGKAKPYIFRGDAYKNLKNRPKAIADYTKSLKIQPSNAQVFLARGDAYYSGGKYEQAIEDYTRSIELDPAAKAYYFRGDAYLNSARYDLGIADYTKAVDIDPEMKNILLYRGDCWMFKGDLDKAMDDYTAASTVKPGEWKAFAYIAELHIMKRDIANAIPAIQKALDDFDSTLPDDEKGTLKVFLDSLANKGAFPKIEDLKKEAETARDADNNPRLAIYAYANFVMQPQSPEANLLLAQSYEKIGWKTSSIRYYLRYIHLVPNSKLNNVVREAIKSLEE